MVELPPITLRLRGRKVVGRVAFTLLLMGAIAVGALAGLLFVYSSDLPQIRALEDFRPTSSPNCIRTTARWSAISPCSAAFCSPTNRFRKF